MALQFDFDRECTLSPMLCTRLQEPQTSLLTGKVPNKPFLHCFPELAPVRAQLRNSESITLSGSQILVCRSYRPLCSLAKYLESCGLCWESKRTTSW